jgi:hypothetical protein
MPFDEQLALATQLSKVEEQRSVEMFKACATVCNMMAKLFDYEIVEIGLDGDCLFRCFLQTAKSLGLELLKKPTIQNLRALVVEHMLQHQDLYSAHTDTANYEDDVRQLAKKGFFSSNIGDATLYALASVCKLQATVLVSSSVAISVIPEESHGCIMMCLINAPRKEHYHLLQNATSGMFQTLFCTHATYV